MCFSVGRMLGFHISKSCRLQAFLFSSELGVQWEDPDPKSQKSGTWTASWDEHLAKHCETHIVWPRGLARNYGGIKNETHSCQSCWSSPMLFVFCEQFLIDVSIPLVDRTLLAQIYSRNGHFSPPQAQQNRSARHLSKCTIVRPNQQTCLD